MSFFTDVTDGVTSLFNPTPAPAGEAPLPLGLMPPEMFGDWSPGPGSVDGASMAFPHYTEEPELPTGLMRSEDIDRVNAEARAMAGEEALPTGLLSEEQIAEMYGGGSQVRGDGPPPVAAETTPGDSTESATAEPPVVYTNSAASEPAAVDSAAQEQVRADHKAKLEEELEEQDFSLLDDTNKQGKLKARIAEMPAEMRAEVVSSLDGDDRDAAQAALDALKKDEAFDKKHAALNDEKRATGAKDFADLATKMPKADPDNPGATEDAQKQYDKQCADALAKIPYKERTKALEEMPDEARAVAQTAMDKKQEEMKGKAAVLFGAINAGAMDNGTDTTTIFQTLATLTPDERKELEAEYGKTYMDKNKEPRDLETDLRKEFKDPESALGLPTRSYQMDRQFLDAVFTGDTAEQKAIALQLAARGSSLTDCTDESLLVKTLESMKDPKEREQAFAIFSERQAKAGKDDVDVSQMIRSELVTGDVDKNDYEYKRALAMSNGQFDEAKAVEVEEAMDPGIMGKVSIRSASSVASVVPGGFLVQGGVELADKLGVIDADKKVGEPDTSKVAEIYGRESSQEGRDKISKNFKENNDGTSVQDTCTDKTDKLLVDSATKNDVIGMKAARWEKAGDKINADEQGMLKQIEGPDAKKVVERIGTEFGDGAFDAKSKAVMNDAELKVNDQMKETGQVDPVTGLLAAAPKISTGWALEDMEKHLRDPKDPKKLRTPEEMAEIRTSLCKEMDLSAEDFDALVDHRLGGKDAFRLKQMMKGEPQTAADRMARVDEEQAFNREGFLNAPGKALTDSFSTAGEAQDAQYAKLKEWEAKNGTRAAEIENKSPDTRTPEENAELAKTKKELDATGGYFDTNVKSYQTSRDTIANDATTLAAGTVGAIASIGTGGTAAPVVAALLSGMTSLATKQALLGETFNTRDRSKEMVQTMVSMGAAGAQVGTTQLLETALEGYGTTAIKELISATVLNAGSMGANGLVSSGGAALLDDKTLQGKGDVKDIAKKVGFGTLSSTVQGGVTGLAGKALDLGGLHAADPTKQQFTAGGHAINKSLSQIAGDGAGFLVDPANLSGPDAFGKFLQKEALALPANLAQGIVDYRNADLKRKLGFMALTPEEAAYKASETEETAHNPEPRSQGFDAEWLKEYEGPRGLLDRPDPFYDNDPSPYGLRAKTDAILEAMAYEADARAARRDAPPEISVEEWDPGMGSAGRPIDLDHIPGPDEIRNWGGNNGGIGEPSNEHLPHGLQLGRDGEAWGRFLTLANTPTREMSLEPRYDEHGLMEYTPVQYDYEVGPRGVDVEMNVVAPLFQQPGGGIQFQGAKRPGDAKSPKVAEMVADGRLIELARRDVRRANNYELVEVADALANDPSLTMEQRRAQLRELGFYMD